MAKVYLLDGTNLLYRAYHALNGFRTSSGMPTNAVFGILNMLTRLLKEEQPDVIAAVFDPKGKTLKHTLYADYKANRSPTPDDLIVQIPYVHRAFDALGIPVIVVEGVEADDVIGTLSSRYLAQGDEVVVVTGDKDFCQLVNERLTLLDTMKNTRLGVPEVLEKMGVPPEKVIDVLALSGDAVDNLPGVPGVGLKTAAKLVTEYGSLEGVVAAGDTIKGKRGEAIRESAARVLGNRPLVTIEKDLDLSLSEKALTRKDLNRADAAALFRELEFKKFLGDLSLNDEPEKPKPQPQPQLLELTQTAEPPKKVEVPENWVAYLEVDGEVVSASAGKGGGLPFSTLAVGHGLKKFRARWAELGIVPDQLGFDTELAAYVLNPGRRDYPAEELARERDIPFPHHQPVEAARALLTLAAKMRGELDSSPLGKLYYEIELPLVSTLARMEAAGVKVDREKLSDLSGEYSGRIEELEKRMFTLVGEEFNPRSPKEISRILFEKLNLPAMKKTATGFSTDAGVLEELSLSHPLPELLLEHRGLTKLKNSFIDTLPELIDPADGRIHTVFQQTVAATGRLSSTNPNLQNIPVRGEEGRRIREAFVAEEGFTLVSVDYSQIEFRVLAHLSGDKVLGEMFATGRDIHAETASRLFDVGPLGVTSDMRRQAKVVNFGILYGMSSFGLARRLSTDLKTSQKIIDTYFARFPGIKGYFASLLDEARATGIATTLFGRTRSIPDIKAKNRNVREAAERLAINTPIQGTAADIMKIAMLKTEKALKAAGINGRMILQVHDELLVEVREEETGRAVEVVKEAMEGAVTLSAPLKAEAGFGPDWLTSHGG